jgi:ABC-type branched-subunit amino acid transport system substrate-binding protein
LRKEPRRNKQDVVGFSAFCSRFVFGLAAPSGVQALTPSCKNLFAKEHNNVAEIYQKSSFSCVGRLSGDGIFRPGGYCDWRRRTGPNATYGDQYWHGATQAAEDINAAGGINNEKIKLVQGDDACEPKQAVAVAPV